MSAASRIQKGMAIASLNVDGLRSHLDEVQLLIRSLGIHILALNETKLDRLVPKEVTDIRGCQQFRQDRTCNGGGEPPKSKQFLIIAWYRPPGGPVCSFDKLEKALAYLDREGRK